MMNFAAKRLDLKMEKEKLEIEDIIILLMEYVQDVEQYKKHVHILQQRTIYMKMRKIIK